MSGIQISVPVVVREDSATDLPKQTSSTILGQDAPQPKRKSICFSPNLVEVHKVDSYPEERSPGASLGPTLVPSLRPEGPVRGRARSMCMGPAVETKQKARKQTFEGSAGKNKPPKQEPKEDVDDKKGNAASTRPEWYEDLNEGQIHMFKEVFELLDRDGGGSLDAGELYNVMQDMEIDVTKDEISTVLKELDKDGNGEIDFDEFLYTMCDSSRYMAAMEAGGSAEDEEGYSRRQRLFFTAITRFAIKNSMGEIERYYANKMRQAPHVISFYTAGVRLIGLNDRQLEIRLREMQKEARGQDSPYAKPLPFVTVRPRKKKPKTKAGQPDKTCRRKQSNVAPAATSMTPRQKPPQHPSPPGQTAGDGQSSSAAPTLDQEAISQIRTAASSVLDPDDVSKLDEALSKIGAAPVAKQTRAMSIPHAFKMSATGTLQPMEGDEELESCESTLGPLPRRSESCENTHQDDATFQAAYQSRRSGSSRRRSAINPDSAEFSEVLRLLQDLAKQGSVVAKLPDVHLVPAIRSRLAQMTDEVAGMDPLCSSVRRRRRTMPEFSNLPPEKQANCVPRGPTDCVAKSSRIMKKGIHPKPVSKAPQGWVMPRLIRGQTPLPVIPLTGAHERLFTVEDVPLIRERVSKALGKYYSSLKKAHVRNDWPHFDQLNTHIPSEKLRENFKQVYSAYSPNKEENVFVVTPWIPQPRYTSRQPGKPQLSSRSQSAIATHPPRARSCVNSSSGRSTPVSRHDSSRPNSVCM